MSFTVGITGARGRMGIANLRAAALHGAVDGIIAHARIAAHAEAAAREAGLDTQAISFTDSLDTLLEKADVVIDFTLPDFTIELAAAAAKAGVPLVSGTTGLSSVQLSLLIKAAKEIPLVWSANMSVGVTVFSALVEQAAAALDDSYDIEIVEMHHRQKVDAPSGTALALGQAAAKGRKVAFDTHAILSREGQTGIRERGSIGFAALRGGQVVGDHTVIFAGDAERFELTHKSQSRDIYAQGSLKAALWARGNAAGFYSMRDVLGI